MKSHWNDLTKYGRKAKRRKYPSLNKIRCRKCKKPKKALCSSSKPLKVFEITYYNHSGQQIEFSDTTESKYLFEMVRRSEFCDCMPKEVSSLKIQLDALVKEKLGENASKNAKRKFIRYNKLPK